MLYKNLKKYIAESVGDDVSTISRLVPRKFDSKIIFFVGNSATNTSEFLSSIMHRMGIRHARYVGAPELECKDRFTQNRKPVYIADITKEYKYIAKLTKRRISAEWMLLLIALRALRNRGDYILIDISCEAYRELIENTSLIPYAAVLCDTLDDKNEECIRITPAGTAEIISLTQKINYDYISSAKSKNGVHLSYSSPNKFRSFKLTKVGMEFFHFKRMYRSVFLNLMNIQFACLALEAARVLFDDPIYPYLFQGILAARPIYDIKICSRSQIIFFQEIGREFLLPVHLTPMDIVYEKDFTGEPPTRPTLYVGSKEFEKKIRHFIHDTGEKLYLKHIQ